MKYASFWQRLGAYILDTIVLLPLSLLIIWGEGQFRLFKLYSFVPGILFSFWFSIFLVKKYGATPGTIIMKIKISKTDGSNVGYREAVLRGIVSLLLSTAILLSIVIIILDMSDDQYFAMQWMERSKYFINNTPAWGKYVRTILNIWVWSEFVVMLLNKERRAIHDLMAGTVVISFTDDMVMLAGDTLDEGTGTLN